MRMVILAGTLVLALASALAGARDTQGALLLTFGDGDAPRLTGVATVATGPSRHETRAAQWTLAAIEANGRTRWTQPLPAPLPSAAGGPGGFAVLAPHDVVGAHLILRDSEGRERWRGVIRQPDLALADAQAAHPGNRRAEASAQTLTLAGGSMAPALRRQLQTQARATPERRIAPPGRTLLVHGAGESTAASERQDNVAVGDDPMRDAALETVTARVVDERGQAPGVAFDAELADAQGNETTIRVNADGALRLPLAFGASYSLALAPPAPLVGAQRSFTWNGEALPDFVIEHGWVVDIHLVDAATGREITAAPRQARLHDMMFGGHIVTQVAGSRTRSAVSRNHSGNLVLSLNGLPGHAPSIDYPLPHVDGDVQLVLKVDAANALSFQVRTANGATPPADTSLVCYSPFPVGAPSYEARTMLDARGAATLMLPPSHTYLCDVQTHDPSSQSFFRNFMPSPSSNTLVVADQVVARFDLVDESGQPLSATLNGEWSATDGNARSACWTSPCRLRLPAATAAGIHFDFDDPLLADMTLEPRIYTNGSRHTVVVRREHQVSGTIAAAVDVYGRHRVRAYDAGSGDLVLSSLATRQQGSVTLPLLTGNYIFELDDNNEFSRMAGDFFYRQPTRSAPQAVTADQPLPDLAPAPASGTFVLQARLPCAALAAPTFGIGSARLVTAEGVRIHRPIGTTANPPPSNLQNCTADYRLKLSPGAYGIAIAPNGWPLQELGDVQITADGETIRSVAFLTENRSQVWRTRVLDAGGAAVRNATVVLYDESQESVGWLTTAADGSLELPWQEGWSVEISAPATGDSMRRRIRFGTDPLPQKLVLPAIDPEPVEDRGLLRIHGNGDRSNRFNLVFLAEGYVAQRESFTDVNDNGMWDGVIWHDLDGDGRFSAGDVARTFGEADYPQDGDIPGLDNEPFDDLNDDGVPNLDDPAKFVQDARNYLRALLGADVWDEHRNALNAWLYFLPSRQTGPDLRRGDGSLLLARETQYGDTFEPERSLSYLTANNLALQDALAAVPEADVAIVLVNSFLPNRNTTVFGGHPAFVAFNSLMAGDPAGDVTPSRQMAMAIGGLCTEDFRAGSISSRRGQASSDCPNVSFRADAVPWRSWLEAGTRAPSRHIDGSIGIYEGAQNADGGAWRPSLRSTMRDLSPFFNAPSRAALATAIRARTLGIDTEPGATPSPPVILPTRERAGKP